MSNSFLKCISDKLTDQLAIRGGECQRQAHVEQCGQHLVCKGQNLIIKISPRIMVRSESGRFTRAEPFQLHATFGRRNYKCPTGLLT